MEIDVLYFAQLREVVRADQERIRVQAGDSVEDVVAVLRKRPGWAMVSSLPLTFAVNDEIVHGNHELHDGDRLALLPPVSGG